MKNFFKKHQTNLKVIVYCFIISLTILLITSKNSPLYGFNDWVDANAFFTMGKSWFNGLIPYRDLFEQKGPLLYLLYGLGYLISPQTFHGVFIIEVLLFTIGLYYLYKTLTIFISTKSSLIILPVFTCFLTTAKAFTHGGSAEELSMFLFFITIYYFFKHFKINPLTKKEMLINGIVAGLILLIKYTFLGLWISFTFAIFVDYLLKKDFKKAFCYPLILLLGMLIPFSVALLYFAITNSVKDFFNIYFVINITAYASERISIIARLKILIFGFRFALKTNTFMTPSMIIICVLIWTLKIPLRAKILFLIMIFFTIFGVFYGLKFYYYYILFILFFSGISYLLIFNLIDKVIIEIPNKVFIPEVIIIFVTSIIYSYTFANYKELIGSKKEDFFQYQFAEILATKENPTIVNMGHLDSGVYTTSGLLPITYFFEMQNIPYEKFRDNIDSFQRYIDEKKTTHIVYCTKLENDFLQNREPNLFKNYTIIAKAYQDFDGEAYIGYLFEVMED